MRKNLAVWYGDRGRYTVQLADYKRRGVWMDLGVWPREGESELGLGVVTEPKVLEVRTAMLAVADTNGLPSAWSRHIAGWEGLKIRERLVAFRDHDEARRWLTDRLEELSNAGVLALVGKTPAAD